MPRLHIIGSCIVPDLIPFRPQPFCQLFPQRHHRALSVASRIISIIFLRMGMINQDLWSVRLVLPDCQIHRQKCLCVHQAPVNRRRRVDCKKMLDQIIIIFQLFPQTRAVHQCGRICPLCLFSILSRTIQPLFVCLSAALSPTSMNKPVPFSK